VASISATEELIIQLTSHELQLNKQSIFIKWICGIFIWKLSNIMFVFNN
jgi:hypothetical protein